MIYQLQFYYGALINSKVIYSVEVCFDDCTNFFSKPITFEPFIKQEIIKQIENDGFNPNDFTYDWLTKEQYKNRMESVISKSIQINN